LAHRVALLVQFYARQRAGIVKFTTLFWTTHFSYIARWRWQLP